MARVVVIGAGLGGLAAAIRLQAGGQRVTLVEALPIPGGRAGQIKEAGYTFDTGPSIITLPSLFHDLWRAAGRHLEDYVDLRPLRPWYKVRFRDGAEFANGGSEDEPEDGHEAMATELARFTPDGVAQYRRFLEATERIYRRGFEDLGRTPFLSLPSFARVVPDLLRLGAHRSTYHFAARHFAEEHLRVVFSFHPLFIGGDPFDASAIYSIVPYLEARDGVWFTQGGTHALVQAMARLFTELGGELGLGDPVEEIVVESGRAAGVRLAKGGFLRAHAVVSNVDPATTYTRLVPARARLRNGDWRYRLHSYSMSCFLLYLGLDRQYPHLHTHTVLMPRDYRGVVKAVFSGRLLEDDLALYAYIPSRSDPSLAPAGGESMYALVPVPHLGGEVEWPGAISRLRAKVFALLRDELGMADVERHVVVERAFTPLDFRDGLRSHLGAAFSIKPNLFQSGYFRPHNRSEDVRGLYLAGAGTHPGAGVPGVLLTAEIAANLVTDEWPVRGQA